MQIPEPSPAGDNPAEAAPTLTILHPLWATGLVVGWSLVTVLGTAAGWLRLTPVAATLLAAVAALTGVLGAGVVRFVAPRQPALAGALVAGGGIALAAALVAAAGGFALPATGVLATGMALSALLLAAPLLPLRWLAGLGAAGLVALPAAGLPGYLASGTDPGFAAVATPAAGFALVLLAAVAALDGFARQRRAAEDQHEQLRGALARARRHVERDQLTNSFSRRHIIEMLAREMARTDRSGEQFCACLLDLDHFKSLNDSFGHLTGDRVLASFARRVRGTLRSMDSISRNGVPSALGRVGGEEFLVILPHTSLRGALRVAERMRRAVGGRPLDGQHGVTVSIGIAEYRGSETVGSLLGRADKALYGAKRSGRNRVHCASREGSTSQVIMPEIPRAS